jgi:hypothetical protein
MFSRRGGVLLHLFKIPSGEGFLQRFGRAPVSSFVLILHPRMKGLDIGSLQRSYPDGPPSRRIMGQKDPILMKYLNSWILPGKGP